MLFPLDPSEPVDQGKPVESEDFFCAQEADEHYDSAGKLQSEEKGQVCFRGTHVYASGGGQQSAESDKNVSLYAVRQYAFPPEYPGAPDCPAYESEGAECVGDGSDYGSQVSGHYSDACQLCEPTNVYRCREDPHRGVDRKNAEYCHENVGISPFHQQVQRTLTQVGSDEDGPHQIPHSVQWVHVPDDIPPEFSESTDGIHEEADRPKKLIRFSSCKILVEDRDGKDKANNSGHQRYVSHFASRLVVSDV